MNYLLEVCLNTAFKALLLSTLFIACNKEKRIYIWLFIMISSLNDLGLRLGVLLSRNFSLQWNWGGKVISILISIAFILYLKHFIKTIPFAEYKISFKQQFTGRKTILLTLILILLPLIGNLFETKANFSIETVLFQMTMPGLGEEISFRGIYLGLLNKVFEKKFRFLECKLGWGLIVVSLLFGAVHGLNISLNHGLSFNALNFFFTGGLGFCFGILAESSKSLVLPIIAHNVFNTFGYLIKVLK